MKDAQKAPQTIFVVISKHIMRRNILETKFWPQLLKKYPSSKIVLIGESGGEEFYEEKFGHPNVEIRFTQNDPGDFWHHLVRFLLRTGTSAHGVQLYLWRHYERGEVGIIPTLSKVVISNTLGNIALYKKFVRALYGTLRLQWVEDLFDEFNPDLVFAPSLIDRDVDAFFGTAARRRGIRVVGMVRSWDNLSIHGLLPFVPDKFLLQNIWLKESAEKFQALDMSRVDHEIIGLPHYDSYKNPENLLQDREEFMKAMGLDPKKPFIYFTGFDIYLSEAMIPKLLNDAIESGKLPKDMQVLFTRHPASPVSLEDYGLSDLPHVHYVDLFDAAKHKFQGTDQIFVNCVSHSEVVLNVASTVAIDCAVLNKPVICIAFDDPKLNLPYWSRAERLFDSFDHYEKLVGTKGARLAYSPEQLLEDICTYLKDPTHDEKERKDVVELFVAPFDGKAGERLVDALE